MEAFRFAISVISSLAKHSRSVGKQGVRHVRYPGVYNTAAVTNACRFLWPSSCEWARKACSLRCQIFHSFLFVLFRCRLTRTSGFCRTAVSTTVRGEISMPFGTTVLTALCQKQLKARRVEFKPCWWVLHALPRSCARHSHVSTLHAFAFDAW
jgi:hypothetical protein